jgi:hypothetical protein
MQMNRRSLITGLISLGATNSTTVTASNASPPVVTNAKFSVALPVTNGEMVGTVSATNNPTSWSITAGNSAGYFAIDSTGKITITAAGASGLADGVFSLTAQATNASGSGSGAVTTYATNYPLVQWSDVVADNGIASTRPCSATMNNGIFPYALPTSYSWYYGGDEYLGDPTRLPPSGWTSMTAWHIVFCEADSPGGNAKPSVDCNVIIGRYASWVHLTSGGWVRTQASPPGSVTTARMDGAESGNNGVTLTGTINSDDTFTEEAPPVAPLPGWCNHGWPDSRGSFAAGTVDGAFSYFEMRVDQPNANKIAASGIDWWQSPTADFPNNTGYSQSAWIRLTQNWRAITGSSVPVSVLRTDPPPPLVGVDMSGGGV